MYPNVPVAVATVGGIVAINLFVFVLWRIPPMWRYLNAFATVVPALPAPSSILVNTFSHSSFAHLISNMAGIALWGIPCKLHISPIQFNSSSCFHSQWRTALTNRHA